MRAKYCAIIVCLLSSFSLQAMQMPTLQVEYKISADQKAEACSAQQSIDCKQCKDHAEKIRTKLRVSAEEYIKASQAVLEQSQDTNVVQQLILWKNKQGLIEQMRLICEHAQGDLEKLIYKITQKKGIKQSIWIFDRSDNTKKHDGGFGIPIIFLETKDNQCASLVLSIDCKRFSQLPSAIQNYILIHEIDHALNNRCVCRGWCTQEGYNGKLPIIRSIIKVRSNSKDPVEQLIYQAQQKLGLQTDIWLCDRFDGITTCVVSKNGQKEVKKIAHESVSLLDQDAGIVISTDKQAFCKWRPETQRFLILHELTHVLQNHEQLHHALWKQLKAQESEARADKNLKRARAIRAWNKIIYHMHRRTHERIADTYAMEHDPTALSGLTMWCRAHKGNKADSWFSDAQKQGRLMYKEHSPFFARLARVNWKFIFNNLSRLKEMERKSKKEIAKQVTT